MHPHLAAHGRTLAAVAAAGLSIALWTTYLLLSRRLTPAQIEERRRLELAAHGRIIDGVLTGAHPSEHTPQLVFYTYRVAGVGYECSQNIAPLPPHDLHLDCPIQVRYNPHNPANSIVLAETWNGLFQARPLATAHQTGTQ